MAKKLISLLLVLVLALSFTLTGCGNSPKVATEGDASKTEGASNDETKKDEPKKADVKVGFIYIGPIGDGGWTYAHNEGRLYLENELGIKALYVESVPENADCEKAMKDLIDQDVNVIFGTSFGYMDHMEKLSKEFPNVKFIHCSGYKMTENMANYFGKIEEPRYLSGIAAGMKTKSNKIGYVAAMQIPEVIRGINAFTLGVRSVNPDAKVYVRWTNTWYDPATEKNAAIALLDEGCDIIAQHQDTTGPQIAAQERNVWAIGYNTDSSKAAPKAYITAPVWNWGPYYVSQVKAVMDGTWKAESYWGGMTDGVVELAPLTENAPEGAKEKIEEVKNKILDGSFQVFAGPIKDQSGAVKVEEGSVLSDEGQLTCDWFVEGVEGKIEK